ncbi:uncharacterized protein Z520_08919 [Fonsecaea multimorphosa CBS 102226]|uniref:Peroxidase n=1 Tax=Fonsecaea multimorphosa CBS 102226 TaxID=1442371 RepID=A0A0D2JPZ2_9EURO|nr:uncharacterized protein Z520_08919 [Fonsecaea multimorphosa CBS 102226]KIX95402.1 hypothetical protein Z520_08919 [Fonsecaea multimorphosa CBS 102226]OAL21069.1 hypothetical protein AYO22_08353 [Fonsecaea multimorphosa]
MSTSPAPSSQTPDRYQEPHPPSPTAGQLDQVKQAIISLLDQPGYDDGSAGPVLVRLAWHSAGTYCAQTNTGGSNGAGMRYEKEGGDPANAGLQHARAFLEPVKRQFPWITYADLWTLAAVVAIRAMGGPEISWMGGRTDFTDDSRVPPRGRLPDGAKGADHLRFIFYRMGFSDREIVCLSGAHNLGRCHADRSGFEGKWVNNPTRFSNTYFKLLRLHDWKKKTLQNGMVQYVYVDEDAAAAAEDEDEEEPEELMMLPSDMALLEDARFRIWVDRYARDRDLFFADFAAVFAKLLELGIRRDGESGAVLNDENLQAGYRSAPKKSDSPTAATEQASTGQTCAHTQAKLSSSRTNGSARTSKL